MKKNLSLYLTLGTLAWVAPLCAKEAPAVHMANGIKIGEVTPSSAIVWTRLTLHPERNVDGKPFPKNVNKERKSLEFKDLAAMEGSVPGAAGDVRVGIRPSGGAAAVKFTDWKTVAAGGDFTCQFCSVIYNQESRIRWSRRGAVLAVVSRRVPWKDPFGPPRMQKKPAHVRFTVVTGQDYPRRDDPANGHKIYPQMQKLDPDFFVHTGDIEYYDKPQPYADNLELARFKWNRLYAMPFQRDFHNRTASYFMKDDHDTLKNDSWPGQNYGDLTWE
jgi:alkaline phosphatase D